MCFTLIMFANVFDIDQYFVLNASLNASNISICKNSDNKLND